MQDSDLVRRFKKNKKYLKTEHERTEKAFREIYAELKIKFR